MHICITNLKEKAKGSGFTFPCHFDVRNIEATPRHAVRCCSTLAPFWEAHSYSYVRGDRLVARWAPLQGIHSMRVYTSFNVALAAPVNYSVDLELVIKIDSFAAWSVFPESCCMFACLRGDFYHRFFFLCKYFFFCLLVLIIANRPTLHRILSLN